MRYEFTNLLTFSPLFRHNNYDCRGRRFQQKYRTFLIEIIVKKKKTVILLCVFVAIEFSTIAPNTRNRMRKNGWTAITISARRIAWSWNPTKLSQDRKKNYFCFFPSTLLYAVRVFLIKSNTFQLRYDCIRTWLVRVKRLKIRFTRRFVSLFSRVTYPPNIVR